MIKKFASLILFCFFVSAGFATVVADYRSTFLIGASQYSTLSWLSDETNNIWREKVIEKLEMDMENGKRTRVLFFLFPDHHSAQNFEIFG